MAIINKLCVLVLTAFVLAACSEDGSEAPMPARDDPSATTASESVKEVNTASQRAELAGTEWELLKIQSMDDSEWAPDDPSRYTLSLETDGKAYMQLDCNQGNASWNSEAPSQITFSLVASTSALCQDDGLSERYANQFEYVRSYVLRDGHLFLATMADGAIIEFRPAN